MKRSLYLFLVVLILTRAASAAQLPGTVAELVPPTPPVLLGLQTPAPDSAKAPLPCPYSITNQEVIDKIKSLILTPHQFCQPESPNNPVWISTDGCMMEQKGPTPVDLLTDKEKAENCPCEFLYRATLAADVSNIDYAENCTGDEVTTTGAQEWMTSVSDGSGRTLVSLINTNLLGVINSHGQFTILWNERDIRKSRCGASARVLDFQILDGRLSETCVTAPPHVDNLCQTPGQWDWYWSLMKLPVGKSDFGKTMATLSLPPTAPNVRTFSRNGLLASGGEVIRDSGGVRQVKTESGLADVTTVDAFSYSIKQYAPADVGPKSSGLYQVSGNPISTVTVSNPNQSTNNVNEVRLVVTQNTLFGTNQYLWVPANQGWTINAANGLQTQRGTEYSTNSNTAEVYVTETYRTNDNRIVSKTISKYQWFNWGKALIEQTENAGASNQLVTSYSYWTNSADFGYTKLKQVVYPSGQWNYSQYETGGRPSRVLSAFGNQGPTTDTNLCQTVIYDYNLLAGAGDAATHTNDARTTSTCLLGKEVARTYLVWLADGKKEFRCQWPSDTWSSSSNLLTWTKYYTNGYFSTLVSSIQFPDGSLEVDEYATNSTQKTTSVYRGQPNAGFTAVTNGTKTISVVGTAGQTISNIVQDIATGITLDQIVYSNFDAQLRPQRVTFLDGTFSDSIYGCCGLDSQTDRDGVTTTFTYDDLKRKKSETRLGITTWYDYDAAGNTLSVQRQPTNGPTITLKTMGYDLANRLVAETNALGGVTTYTTYQDASGQTIKVTVKSDGGSRTETYARDGSTLSITGTAARPVRYQYGLILDNGAYRPVKREIKLDTNGADTLEASESYTDMLGQTYKTVYAAAASPYPFAQSFYNNKGQLWKQVDPDGVVTLYQYNLKGEVEYTATDLNRNDVIDFSGTDRITQTVSDVIANYGTSVRRTRTYLWPTDNSGASFLVNTVETSVDGLRTWTTTAGLVTQSQTVHNGGGLRTVTVTAPDGTSVVTQYQNGRLASVTRKDSGGSQITQTTYSYDAHGRQSATTDARTGSTTYTYSNADQVLTATTPVAGTGLKAQTTTTSYNGMLQPWKVVYADGGSVTNEFYLTGDLKKTCGARTYPVEYTYDTQGRMKTLKTWQNYAGNSGAATTTWNYDAYRGFLANKLYYGNNGGSYTYTAAGRAHTRTWARGITCTYGYNNGGDLQSLSYSDGVTPGVTYAYDRRGRQASVTRNSITTSLSYNDANQVLTESYAGGSLAGLSVTRGYDGYLRQNAISLNTSPAVGHSFGYDTASRLQTASDGSYSALYSYLANSMLISQVLLQQSGSTRMTTTKQYDNLNRLTRITAGPASAVPWSFRYGYDDAALGTDQAYQRVQCTWSDSSYWLYAYDKLGQVAGGKRYWSDNTLVAGQQYEYVYDDIGNRTLVRMGGDEAGGNLREAGYSPTLLNEYSSRVVPPVIDIVGMAGRDVLVTANNSYPYRKGEYFYQGYQTGGGPAYLYQSVSAGGSWTGGYVYLPPNPESYTYVDGDLWFDGRWRYTWDGENRLSSLESYYGPDNSKRRQEFEYDYLSRCIRKKTYTWTSGYYQLATDTKYLYEGWKVIAELNASNGLVRSYLWGLDLSGTRDGAGGVGGLVELTSYSPSTTHHFYACDGNGNVAGLLDANNGATSAQYEYGPFGELIRMTGTIGKVNPFRWSCKLTDDDTDLAYYGYRYYNPSTGRWLSRDLAGETSGSANLYAAFSNNPANLVDALGQWGFAIHHDATLVWAFQQGYAIRAADAIGTADADVDNVLGGTGPWPWIGDQSYHFNRNLGGGGDSRLAHSELHNLNAVRACSRAVDDPITAARELGTSLHPLQDYYAHGDFFIRWQGPITMVHNAYSPQTGVGSVSELPDDPGYDAVGSPDRRPAGRAMRYFNVPGGMLVDYAMFVPGTRRFTETQQSTTTRLVTFRAFLVENGGCRCRAYFLKQ